MNKYTFSTQSGKAYYCNSIPGFIEDRADQIIGQLVRHAFEINKDQSEAWNRQISELQCRLKACGMAGDIIFEYDIVRLGKRIDVILLIRHMVFSLEFKNGKTFSRPRMRNRRRTTPLTSRTSIRSRRICMSAQFS